ncbi:hypothetical protein ACTGZO_10250 [Streptococcus suis]
MKKILRSFVALALFFSLTPSVASASVGAEIPSPNLINESTIEPFVYYHRYKKTITHYYGTENAIPISKYYSEYNNSFSTTFSGNLHLTGVRRSNGGYYATYSGTLVGAWQ